MTQTIAIIDYGMGNLHSIYKTIKQITPNVQIASEKTTIQKADKLILPGVGHFGKAMEQLKILDLIEVLDEQVLIKKKPILGICLGMQLFAKHSEEGNVNGLGWIDAEVKQFNIQNHVEFKVPHTGWGELNIQKVTPIFESIPHSTSFYFVHSFFFHCFEKEAIIATTEHEQLFTSSVQKENIYGMQFHPEKSHRYGKQLLKNFIEKI
ncbi:MAG: imidazole glycerol phosphate synthase subunit HisH [Crocinitomicaceae bacterium]|nr:imidazole glycerol phosphate synthase subunit HisH [Crocinitomicaceae bacterium]